MIFRLPRDPHQRASLFASHQAIIVNEGEVAVVLEDGKAGGALPPGKYIFEKARITGALDIVWVITGQQGLKWGLGNVSSSDGIQLSANGVVYVRVDDARTFNAEVIQGAERLAEVDLQRLLMPRLQGVIRTVLAKWPALELQTQRELFNEGVATALTETFLAMGLAIVSFEVVEVNFPPEFKAIIAAAAMSKHAGNAALIEAQTRSQVMQLEAMGAAQAQLTAGMAQVQVMAQLQAQGIDPLKLKALGALEIFAANPAQGGMMVGGDAARTALFAQIAGAAVTPGVPVNPMPALTAPSAAAPPQVQAAPTDVIATATNAPPTAEELDRQLDALTERLGRGKDQRGDLQQARDAHRGQACESAWRLTAAMRRHAQFLTLRLPMVLGCSFREPVRCRRTQRSARKGDAAPRCRAFRDSPRRDASGCCERASSVRTVPRRDAQASRTESNSAADIACSSRHVMPIGLSPLDPPHRAHRTHRRAGPVETSRAPARAARGDAREREGAA